MTRRLFPKALVLAALAGASLAGSFARAQGDAGPAVILTAKSAGELIADLRFLAGAVAKPDDPQVAQVLAMLDNLKDPQALQGLDPSKPLGIFGSLPEGDKPPTAVIFLPVLDANKLFAALGGIGATVEADNSSPGFTHKVMLPNSPFPLFATQGGGYLYLSMAPVNANGLKAMKPATLLPKRAGAGDLSLTLRLDRIPAAMKQQFTDALDANLAPQREKRPNESDSEYQGRLAGMDMSQKALVGLVRDGKELGLDLLIDSKTEFVGLELNSSAVPASEYGKALRKLASMKSRFRGMTANAAIGGYAAIPVAQSLRDLIGKALDAGFAQANPNDENAQKIVDEMKPILRDIMTSETLDLGVAVQGPSTGSAPSYSLSAAMAVKGGKKLEKVIRDAAKSVPAEQRKDLKLDFAKAADGTAIHKLTGPPTAQVGPFGEPVVYAAFRDDTIAFGFGKGGQAALTTALGAKAPVAAATATAPQVEILVSASKLSGISKEPKEQMAMSAAAKEVFTGAAAKKDKISLVLKGQGDAMSLRVGLDVPALKFIVRMNEITKGGQ